MEAKTEMANQPLTTKALFAREDVQAKFKEMLGKRAPQFITSVLHIASSSDMLSKADPASIYGAAAVAATLDLPLNASLGFAAIVPFNSRQQDGSYKVLAQFMLMTRGLKQLALRSGQFDGWNTSDVREGEMKKRNRLTGDIEFDWVQDETERLKKPVVGYVHYFRLINGFSQTLYMSVEQIKEHGKRYSKTFNNQNGLWNTDFNAMAEKTVTKLNLSKNAPLSVDMRTAINVDQSVIRNPETEEIEYVDATDQKGITEKPNALEPSNEPPITVKTPNTEAVSEDAGKPNPEVQDKTKTKPGQQGKIL